MILSSPMTVSPQSPPLARSKSFVEEEFGDATHASPSEFADSEFGDVTTPTPNTKKTKTNAPRKVQFSEDERRRLSKVRS